MQNVDLWFYFSLSGTVGWLGSHFHTWIVAVSNQFTFLRLIHSLSFCQDIFFCQPHVHPLSVPLPENDMSGSLLDVHVSSFSFFIVNNILRSFLSFSSLIHLFFVSISILWYVENMSPNPMRTYLPFKC